MRINFSKMQGLGNDFVVIDAITQQFDPTPEQCRIIADRRFGIGCDQILLIQAPQDPDTDFYYRIFNQDGSEVEQCGNGARCIARFIHDQGLTTAQAISVGTRAGPIMLFLEANNQIRVNMGLPRFLPHEIPFIAGKERTSYPLMIDRESIEVGVVSMGNPHAVIRVVNLDQTPVASIGSRIETHARFPKRVNVGFMQIMTRDHIRLRVYERGVGETLACGTGACAAVVVGHSQGVLDTQVQVSLPGGDLLVQWAGTEAPVWMTGPAVRVFDGSIDIN